MPWEAELVVKSLRCRIDLGRRRITATDAYLYFLDRRMLYSGMRLSPDTLNNSNDGMG
jgi:hypothetical protein